MLVCLFITIMDFLTISAGEIEGRVVQGEKAAIQQHPYSAFISVVSKSGGAYVAHICGSSIVNQKILLTAAHCFETLTTQSKVKANIGHADKRKGYIRNVGTVKVHPKYDERKIINDIALAGLQEPLQFSEKVNRIALATRLPNKGTAILAGWGLVNEVPTKGTNILHATDQQIWTQKDCTKLLKRIPPGTFCGGSAYTERYPSVGDSGSPLVMNGFLQIGLVSFKKLDISRSIIIYTDIPYFYNWIAENAGAVYCG